MTGIERINDMTPLQKAVEMLMMVRDELSDADAEGLNATESWSLSEDIDILLSDPDFTEVIAELDGGEFADADWRMFDAEMTDDDIGIDNDLLGLEAYLGR